VGLRLVSIVTVATVLAGVAKLRTTARLGEGPGAPGPGRPDNLLKELFGAPSSPQPARCRPRLIVPPMAALTVVVELGARSLLGGRFDAWVAAAWLFHLGCSS
jgi:hypothetical protein